jgi:hypothetical protein
MQRETKFYAFKKYLRVIPALRSLRQEDHEFEASLINAGEG